MNELEEDTNLYGCPDLNSVFKGVIVSVQEYGAFIKIPGCKKNGLVHKSQISVGMVENASEVLNKDQTVWCKVINLGRNNEDELKIGLSMKVVDQGSGKDLDPNHIETDLQKRRGGKGYVKPPSITLEAVYNTVCKRCGTKGHLAQNCFQQPGGKVYELVPDGEVVEPQHPATSEGISTDHKEKKKKSKHKKNKKHKRSKGSDDESPPKKKKCKEAHRKKHKKHH